MSKLFPFQIPEGSKGPTLRNVVLKNGLGTPFINVSFSGLLWGYEDELYCLELDVPKGCDKGNDPFSSGGGDDPFGGGGDDWDFKRRKRSVSSQEGIFEKPGKVNGIHVLGRELLLVLGCENVAGKLRQK